MSIDTFSGFLVATALTGEALPVNVSVGEAVYSGSLNINGLFKIQVTKNFGNSTVVKILEMVENATAKNQKQNSLLQNLQEYILLLLFVQLFYLLSYHL